MTAKPWKDRFLARVVRGHEDECWPWRGSSTSGGYGTVMINGKMTTAHRCMWMIEFGDIPDGKVVCHACDNPSCINPRHLWLGTPKDNTNDMIQKKRHKPGHVPGEKNGQAKLTHNDIYSIRECHAYWRLSHRAIAKKFNVSKTQIGRILRYESWNGG